MLIRYGAVGYAIYFHCLELIANDIGETNITFELEHDAEIIADNLRISGTADKAGVDLVNEIMRYMVHLGLFEDHDGRITCFKLLKRLDASMTSNPRMRSLISAAKANHDYFNESHDTVMTESCKKRLEETRLEEKREREEQNASPSADSEDFQKQPHAQVANAWFRHYAKRTTRMVSPAARDYKRCKEVMDRGYTEADMLDAIGYYFDPENKAFPQYEQKTQQFRYNFANFLSNIDSIASARASPSRAEEIRARYAKEAVSEPS